MLFETLADFISVVVLFDFKNPRPIFILLYFYSLDHLVAAFTTVVIYYHHFICVVTGTEYPTENDDKRNRKGE